MLELFFENNTVKVATDVASFGQRFEKIGTTSIIATGHTYGNRH